MMKIVKLSPSKKIKGKYFLYFQDDTVFSVGEQEILDFALTVGRELTMEEAERLESLGNLSLLKNKAYNLLSRKPMSTADLGKKLQDWEASPQEIEEITQRFLELQLLDDEEYSKILARHHHNKGYGRKKIEQELYRHGISRELWEDAIAPLEPKEDVLEKFINQRLKGDNTDPKKLKKVSDALARRGFSWSEIKEALSRYDETIALYEED